MKDTIIKGNGKSRIIKAPDDMPATYTEWRDQLIAGNGFLDTQVNTDVASANAGLDTLGTALNKANLLTDATATALGLTQTDPTINDALSLLGGVSPAPLSATYFLAGDIAITSNAEKKILFASEYSSFEIGDQKIVNWQDGDYQITDNPSNYGDTYYHVWVGGNVACYSGSGMGPRAVMLRRSDSGRLIGARGWPSINTAGYPTYVYVFSIPEVYLGKVKVGTTFGLSAYQWASGDIIKSGTEYPSSYITIRAIKI